jgi:hypothetical protein
MGVLDLDWFGFDFGGIALVFGVLGMNGDGVDSMIRLQIGCLLQIDSR